MTRKARQMDLFASINDFASWLIGPRLLVVAAIFAAILYFGFKRRAEFSQNAIQNTSATIVVYALNMTASMFFAREINDFAQSAYKSLHIPTLPADFWGGPTLVIGFVVAIFAKDFCDYVIHRAMHTKWGWPAHAAHHTDTHVNGFTAFRVHFIEPTLMMVNYLFVLTWMQLPQLIPAMVVLVLIHNIYVHLDLDWDHGRFKYLLASPVFHRWHHADVPQAYGKNLANMIPLYDLIFGTYYEAGRCQEPMGALKAGLSDKNPILIWIYPFTAWARLIGEALGKAVRAFRPRHDIAPPKQRDLPPAE